MEESESRGERVEGAGSGASEWREQARTLWCEREQSGGVCVCVCIEEGGEGM